MEMRKLPWSVLLVEGGEERSGVGAGREEEEKTVEEGRVRRRLRKRRTNSKSSIIRRRNRSRRKRCGQLRRESKLIVEVRSKWEGEEVFERQVATVCFMHLFRAHRRICTGTREGA